MKEEGGCEHQVTFCDPNYLMKVVKKWITHCASEVKWCLLGLEGTCFQNVGISYMQG